MDLAASFLRGRPWASLAEIGGELPRMSVAPRSGGAWADSSGNSLAGGGAARELYMRLAS
jgi:hypothetical protein